MQSLAVFCGSRAGSDPQFVAHASLLGRLMAAQNITLIYGGGSVGIMGAVADAVMEHGGTVTGVIPELLLAWEAQHMGITELKIVADMHVRKRLMYEMAEAAIVLPGGHGTLDELFEMLTWNSLKIHDKHIYILNTNGFYNHLIAHLHQMFASEFLYDKIENRITVLNDPGELLEYL
ncbi:MAG: TIGR00730 family Rossman fold protein [Chitinophagaceae bacterium]